MKQLLKPDERVSRLILPESPKPGVTYVPSQFAVRVTAPDGTPCLFNTLTFQCMEAKLPASARAGGEADELIAARFLVPEGLDECGYYGFVFSLMHMAEPPSGSAGYTILPTMGCNARCVYCYEQGMEPVSMTRETEEATLRYILNTRGDRPVRLSWFGGEPLLRPDVMDRLCAGLGEAQVPYSSTMISNGSLITPEIIGKMTGLWHLRSLQISMDGAEEDYIARKCYPVYDGVYRRVLENVNRMAAAGIRVTVRCNVDGDNWERIPRFLEDLKAAVADRRRVSVYLAPLNAVREGENALPLWDAVRAAQPLIRAAGFRASGAIRLRRGFRLRYCMADADHPVIAPDGSLYACEHCPPQARFGDVRRGVTEEAALRAFTRMDDVREKCRDCPFLPLCTGFRSCPVADRDCRGVMMRAVEDLLAGMKNNHEGDAGHE